MNTDGGNMFRAGPQREDDPPMVSVEYKLEKRMSKPNIMRSMDGSYAIGDALFVSDVDARLILLSLQHLRHLKLTDAAGKMVHSLETLLLFHREQSRVPITSDTLAWPVGQSEGPPL